MLKRLLLGFIKGALVGGLIGAGLHFGLGWTAASGVLAYALAMGAGGLAGLLTGKPFWKAGAGIENVLKAVVGVGIGAGVYYAASRWLAMPLPAGLPELEAGALWTEVPLLITTAVAATYGTLIELDNDDDGDEAPAKGPKVRVAVDEEALAEEPVEVSAGKQRSR